MYRRVNAIFEAPKTVFTPIKFCEFIKYLSNKKKKKRNSSFSFLNIFTKKKKNQRFKVFLFFFYSEHNAVVQKGVP